MTGDVGRSPAAVHKWTGRDGLDKHPEAEWTRTTGPQAGGHWKPAKRDLTRDEEQRVGLQLSLHSVMGFS